MKMKLSTKLIGLFVLIGLAPFLIVCFYGYRTLEQNLENVSRQRLSSVQEGKKMEIERYVRTIENQVVTFSQDRMIVDALSAFSSSYNMLEDEDQAGFASDKNKKEEQLRARYYHQQANTLDAPEEAAALWWPDSLITQMLQHYYISANPFPIGEKAKLDMAEDGSSYSYIHQTYHPAIHNYLAKFGYYDIFLIDPDGSVVYTVFKELDFATNLVTGPYNQTGLAKVFKSAVDGKNRDRVFFADFEPYAPSYNLPAAFIASPVYNVDRLMGVLAFQISIETINDVMTSNQRWKEVGMGDTGETFMVGPDFLFRSQARPLLDNQADFIKKLDKNTISQGEIRRIEATKSVIGALKFKSPAAADALAGQSGVVETKDYLGRDVLLAYAPLEMPGTTWGLISLFEKKELFASLLELKEIMLFIGVVGVIAVVAAGFFFARTISRPLNQIIGVLSTSSTEIAATVEQQERIAQQQAAAVQETNTTMEELGASSRASAQQAEAAAESARDVLDLSDEGSRKMVELVEELAVFKENVDRIAGQILNLSQQTAQIEDITKLVTDFAHETKMLAMNAAVEAVRAGENGKGFSVLSVEIRKLADESKRSAERIGVLAADIQKVTNATVMATEEGSKNAVFGAGLAKETEETFIRVSRAVEDASENSQQISLNVQQQAIAIKQVLEAMNILSLGARESSTGIGQVKIGIKTLNEAALKLKRMV
ncbi:MAG: methyl-accepting chemotaxis protein [Pseudomonadota bacterium]